MPNIFAQDIVRRPAIGADRAILPRPAPAAPNCSRARNVVIAAACCWLAITTPLALLDPRVVQQFADVI